MKKRYLALLMGVVVGASLLVGCGTSTEQSSETSTEDETAEKVYGEITAIGDNSFTLDSGIGNAIEVTVDDDTEITSQVSAGGMGGMQGGGDMEMPSDSGDGEEGESTGSDGSAPEMPDGESGGSAPEIPDGESDGSASETSDRGSAPEMPEGENGAGGDSVPEMPGGSGASGETESGSSAVSANTLSTADTDNSDEDSGGSGDTDAADSADDADGDSGSAPGGDGGEGADGEMPSGDMPSDDMGDMSSEGMGDMSSAGTTEIEFEDLAVGDVVAVSYDSDGDVVTILVLYSESSSETDASGDMGGSADSSAADISYTAVNEYSEDTTVDGETITSTGTDENAALITNGASVTITGSSVSRDSSDSTGGDNSSFYGVGAAILTTEGTTYISDTTVETDAAGGAGVFAYGDGVVYVADSTITTQQDTSGGIHAAGGGTLYAWDLTVETNGESAAAIRSDRGGGTMVVDGGTYTSNGTGSPAVYCTADIAVNDAELTATSSEAVCIEGLNTLRLFDCDLTGSMQDDSQNDCTWNVILYQSMSGDSEVGNSIFEMSGGSLTAENGGMFYTTNTESTFTLYDVDITYAEENDFFLQCTGNSNERGWGTSGANGADCLFTAISQEMEGDIIWDSISQLDFYMTDGSTLTGAVVNDETWAGDGGDGYCNLYIEEGSAWVVTGDSVLSSLQNEGSIVDASGNTVSIVGSDGTVYVEGSSEYTITVESYETTADLSGASTISVWSDYEVERPKNVGIIY
ncbi:MAG: hypothetical protein LIO96_10555 [Lachnospiraceae bacterium]|nr:hypothetical protein [Lachnospiraceae bacterium]